MTRYRYTQRFPVSGPPVGSLVHIRHEDRSPPEEEAILMSAADRSRLDQLPDSAMEFDEVDTAFRLNPTLTVTAWLDSILTRAVGPYCPIPQDHSVYIHVCYPTGASL